MTQASRDLANQLAEIVTRETLTLHRDGYGLEGAVRQASEYMAEVAAHAIERLLSTLPKGETDADN